jgi:hypothetical protein
VQTLECWSAAKELHHKLPASHKQSTRQYAIFMLKITSEHILTF